MHIYTLRSVKFGCSSGGNGIGQHCVERLLREIMKEEDENYLETGLTGVTLGGTSMWDI